MEFQYNNHIHASTQFSPFFLDTGHDPRMGFKPCMHPLDNQAVNKFVDKMKVAQEEAKAALAKAKDVMAHCYDCGHTPALKYASTSMHWTLLQLLGEAVAPPSGTVLSGAASRSSGLLAVPPHWSMTTPPGVQCSKAFSSTR